MRPGIGFIAGMLAAGLVGCRSNPVEQSYRQTIHSEVRVVEDQRNTLYFENMALRRELERYQLAANARQSGGAGQPAMSATGQGVLRSDSAEMLPAPTIGVRSDRASGSSVMVPPIAPPRSPAMAAPPEELLEPLIEFGQPGADLRPFDPNAQGRTEPSSGSGSVFAALARMSGLQSDPLPPADHELPPPIGFSGIDLPPPTAPALRLPDLPPDHRVTHLVIDPKRTGGRDFDGEPGDDGLTIAFQPRNASDGYVPLPAAMSIVVLDPAEVGEAQRVARWDLSADEIASRLATLDDAAERIQLHLPWTEQPPRHARLTVFVRYTTPDGRKLETRGEVQLRAAGSARPIPTGSSSREADGRWTPRGPVLPRLGLAPTNGFPASPTSPVSEPPRTLTVSPPDAPAAPTGASQGSSSGSGSPMANGPASSTQPGPTVPSAVPTWTPYR